MRPSKKIAVIDLSFDQKIIAKYRMGKRNPFWLPTMIFYKSAEPFFLNPRLIQGWLSLSLPTQHFFFLLLKNIENSLGSPLGSGGNVPWPPEKALFWIRREIKSEDPLYLPWLKRIESVLSSKLAPDRINLLLGFPRSRSSFERPHPPARIVTFPLSSIGKEIDRRTGGDSRKDKGIRPQFERDKGKQLEPLNQRAFFGNNKLYRKAFRLLTKIEIANPGIPLAAGDKEPNLSEGFHIHPFTIGLQPSLFGNRVALKTGHDSRTDKPNRRQPEWKKSRLPEKFLTSASLVKRVPEKHLFPFALLESLSKVQIHIPGHVKSETSDMASHERSTGYGAENQAYFFRKQVFDREIESLKKSMAMTRKALEEGERHRSSADEMDILRHINIHHLADQVYRSIERRITVDRERRGIY